MQSFLDLFWKSRWRRLALLLLICCGGPLLHPFVRQSIFGPTIDGIPWCVWENDFRADAQPVFTRRPWFYEMLEKLGLLEPQSGKLSGNSDNLLPLYLHLAEDRDVHVRRLAIHSLTGGTLAKHSLEIVPVLRRHLQDDDALCRVRSASEIWGATKEPEVRAVLLAELDHPDKEVRDEACWAICAMASRVPELFPTMARLTEDPDWLTRASAFQTMQYFGKQAIPIIRKGLRDPNKLVQRSVINPIMHLKKDAVELIPDLLGLQNHANPDVRETARTALHAIDPDRFPDPHK